MVARPDNVSLDLYSNQDSSGSTPDLATGLAAKCTIGM